MSADDRYPSAEMARRGRLGALTTLSRHDIRDITRPGLEAAEARFEKEVDPEGVLAIEERQRRAKAARQLFYARLAEASAKARREKRRSA